MSDVAMAESEALLEEALYNAGVIYKEDLEDVDNAIEMFDELTQRFPNSKHLATAYYQLYRLYVKKESGGNYFGAGYRDNSEYYKAIILEEFPFRNMPRSFEIRIILKMQRLRISAARKIIWRPIEISKRIDTIMCWKNAIE